MKQREIPYKTFEEFIKDVSRRDVKKKLHRLCEDRLEEILKELYPNCSIKQEIYLVPGGRADLVMYLDKGRVHFEIFATKSQVPRDLLLLEHSNADIKIAIILDREIDPSIDEEYFRRKPDKPFPWFYVSDIMVTEKEKRLKKKLKKIIDTYYNEHDAKERPRLKIDFDPKSHLCEVNYHEGIIRKFCFVKVSKIGKGTAKRCRAILEILSPNDRASSREFKLHWADIDYTFQTDTSEPVNIQTSRYLDVVFSQPKHEYDKIENEFKPMSEVSNHKTDTLGTASVSGSGSVITKTVPDTPLKSVQHITKAPSKGAWIAIPIALTAPNLATQAYLPPDEYLIKLTVIPENGEGDTKCFKIISHSSWEKLSMEQVKCPETEKNRDDGIEVL